MKSSNHMLIERPLHRIDHSIVYSYVNVLEVFSLKLPSLSVWNNNISEIVDHKANENLRRQCFVNAVFIFLAYFSFLFLNICVCFIITAIKSIGCAVRQTIDQDFFLWLALNRRTVGIFHQYIFNRMKIKLIKSLWMIHFGCVYNFFQRYIMCQVHEL